jgi:hypothetical protein
MNKQSDESEIVMINKRLAELFDKGSSLSIALARLAKEALDQSWSNDRYAAASGPQLAELTAMRAEIHKLTGRLAELKDRDDSALGG